jgi:hypothetical protein
VRKHTYQWIFYGAVFALVAAIVWWARANTTCNVPLCTTGETGIAPTILVAIAGVCFLTFFVTWWRAGRSSDT